MRPFQQTIQEAERHLAGGDQILAALIARHRPLTVAPRTNYFESLSRSIVGQQVSVAAAQTIYQRFADGTNLDPKVIEQLELEKLREFGLSRQKASYLRDLAAHFVADAAVFNHLERLNDEAVIEELRDVKGVGTWTAQMFLMSTLLRTDVFAPDDVGLQRAMRLLYPKAKLKKPHDFDVFALRWQPYRTVACRYLWKSLDNDLSGT